VDRKQAKDAAARALAESAQLVLPPPAHGQPSPPKERYSERLAHAFAFAASQHKTQARKGTNVPYVTHLMAVASLVGEHGGGEDEMMAALLHDAVEDTGGAPVLVEIRARFGDAVAAIVAGCTDDDSGGPKRPWLERKRAYIAHVAEAELPVLRVSCADKLHNLRTLLADLRVHGPSVWGRFRGGREASIWSYRALSSIFDAVAAEDARADDGFRRLAGELARAVVELDAC
jgi:(p)ppGpp synthase/HD superfamily hydrolase